MWLIDFIMSFLKFSRSYILLYSLPTNPLTGIIYTVIAVYGFSKLKHRISLDLESKLDVSKLTNNLLIFFYSVSLLGFINFILENVWLSSFLVKYHFFNDGWLDQIYFNVPSGWLVNYLRNCVYILCLFLIAHDVFKYLHWNNKTLLGFIVLSLYIVGFFMLSPHYSYIDWSYALMMEYPNETAITSFLLSMGGKPMLFYIFSSLFLPKKKTSIDQFYEVLNVECGVEGYGMTYKALTLDVGCGASPRGSVNIDRLEGSDRHPMELYKIPNLVVADAHFLPFRVQTFEKTYCFHMMEHIQEDRQVYDELSRVTRNEIEIRVPWWIWEKVMNKVMWWTPNEQFRKEHHVRKYLKKDYLVFLRSCYQNASIQVNYGFLDFYHGLHQEIKRETCIPFPLPFELVANISLGAS